ncbi:50S ribosomal protein L29 [bacterium]|nr:50S ribosomal protein L29 [bacterium]
MSKKLFADMSNEELCAIISNLKTQLVEARFKMSSGELTKVNVFSQIRKSIARIFSELTNRGYSASLSTDSVILYDLKNTKNKPIIVSGKKIKEIIAKQQLEAKKKIAVAKPTKVETINQTKKISVMKEEHAKEVKK